MRQTNADGTYAAYEYDVHDNVSTRLDYDGTWVESFFDVCNRETNRTVTPGPGVSSDTTFVVYEYDGLSRIVSAQDDDALVAYSYDSMSNVPSETLNGQTTTYEYDGVGNVLRLTYPGGREIDYTYDGLDRRISLVDAGGPIATYNYVGLGRVERREYGNSTRTDYMYDGIANDPNDFGVKQVVQTSHSEILNGDLIDDRTYIWDRNQNKVSRLDVRPQRRDLYRHAYAYDAIDRLTRTVVTAKDGMTVRDEQYALDGAGNRTSVMGGRNPGLYTCEAAEPPADCQLNQYTTTPSDAREYDANGNLVMIGVCRQGGDSNCDGSINSLDIDAFVLAFDARAGRLGGGIRWFGL